MMREAMVTGRMVARETPGMPDNYGVSLSISENNRAVEILAILELLGRKAAGSRLF
jgi:hypothetical protein